jgi:hypothetical protein
VDDIVVTDLHRLSRMTETQLGDLIVDAARLYHWSVVHFRPARTAKGWRTPFQGDSGFPDLVLAKNGRIIMAELKIGRAKPRPDQRRWGEQIGPEVYRLWTDRDLQAILKELREG